ncbi:MAG: hypothetical protein KA715_14085 [Xanthomonadaceae bacterium]|nr:hypothetical protein [Xanthomonadaceae bacterium]
MRAIASACFLLILSNCTHATSSIEDKPSECKSPLIELVQNQIALFGEEYPEQFAIYNFIIPTDIVSVQKLNHYGILTLLFFSRNPKDYSIKKVGSKSIEEKSFYEYPSVFEFPIHKNVIFKTKGGKKLDYIEQDLHVLVPAHQLSEKKVWELVTKKGLKIPLFNSPIPGSEKLKEKPQKEKEPDLAFSAQTVLSTYCIQL